MIVPFFLFIIIVWLIGLTYFTWKIQAHYNSLTEGTNGKTLQAVLDTILSGVHTANMQIGELQQKTKALQQEGTLHIQKIGLIRFNPFKDTGGDQSFVLALLNNHDTGIVISGLYARTGTRWYAKKVENGKGSEHELSEDEKKAIAKANVA